MILRKLREGAGPFRYFSRYQEMKTQKSNALRQVAVGAALAGVAGLSMAVAPTNSTELAEAISWADATGAVLVGSAAIIAFKVIKQAASIVMSLIPKAK